MARFLIYSTGTTWTGTILRTSATNNPSVGEASLSNDVFVFPEIQPLYLWQVSGGNVIPNTDQKITLYEENIAPAPTPQDLATYGELTGMTAQKITKVTGATGEVPIFTAGGELQTSNLTIAELTGLTTYTFVGSGGTTITQAGNIINIRSTIPSGATIAWNDVSSKPSWLTGTTLQAFEDGHAHDQYLTNLAFTGYSATTAGAINGKLATSAFTGYSATTKIAIDSKIAKVTGVTSNIAIFDAGGNVISGAKQLTNTVRGTGVATDGYVPSEKGVRDAINSAVAAAIILQGDWNASTNTPNLSGTGITTGYAWRVSVSGTTNLGGIVLWSVGDMAVKSASGWIRIVSEDIAAVWGNIRGTLANQTDLQDALNAKLDKSIYQTYTGTTAPNTFASKSAINTYTGTTAPNTFASKSAIATYTGTTAPAQFLGKTAFTGYSATTKLTIDSKLATSIFTGYTASTANKDKKIQLISTLTSNANVISPLIISWNSASPYATDIYTWTGGSSVWIDSAGTYELQYHVLLKNDGANQTHSVGAYVVKNGSTEVVTATAGMIIGSNATGELSLPPVILTLAANDRLDLAAFRIGNSGNANLVSGSVFMALNKLS